MKRPRNSGASVCASSYLPGARYPTVVCAARSTSSGVSSTASATVTTTTTGNALTGTWTATTLVQNDYGYDNIGNRLTNQVSDHNGVIRTEQYSYDELSRLTSVNYGDGQTQTYSFDPMGNRLQKTDSASVPNFWYTLPGRAETTYEKTPPAPNPNRAIEIAKNAK